MGGTNPLQQGFGVRIGSIDSIQTQGSLEPSGNDLDFGLQGRGFFVVNNGTQNLFTRAGNFALDQSRFWSRRIPASPCSASARSAKEAPANPRSRSPATIAS